MTPKRRCRFCGLTLGPKSQKPHCSSPQCDWCWGCWIERGGKPPK